MEVNPPTPKSARVIEAVEFLQETQRPVTRTRLVRFLHQRDPAAWCLPNAPDLPDSKRVDACVSKLIQSGQLDHVGASEYEAPVRRSKAPPGPPPPHLQLVPPPSAPPPDPVPLTGRELWLLTGMARSPVIGKARRGGSPLTLQDAREMFGVVVGTMSELAEAATMQVGLAQRFVAFTGETAVYAPQRMELLQVCRVLQGIVERAILSSQAG